MICDIIHKESIRFRADKRAVLRKTRTALNVILSNCTKPRTGCQWAVGVISPRAP